MSEGPSFYNLGNGAVVAIMPRGRHLTLMPSRKQGATSETEPEAELDGEGVWKPISRGDNRDS